MSIIIEQLSLPKMDKATERSWISACIEIDKDGKAVFCTGTSFDPKMIRSYPVNKVQAPHGRLIDADAVIQGLRDGLAEIARKNGKDIEPENVYVQTTIKLLNAAPTIVEAEGYHENNIQSV